MTIWYRCELCHHNFIGLHSIHHHLGAVHFTKERKYEMINDEKEVEALKWAMAEKRMKRRQARLQALQNKKDAETLCGHSSVGEKMFHLKDGSLSQEQTNMFANIADIIVRAPASLTDTLTPSMRWWHGTNANCAISILSLTTITWNVTWKRSIRRHWKNLKRLKMKLK